jgi:hypothetical protein
MTFQDDSAVFRHRAILVIGEARQIEQQALADAQRELFGALFGHGGAPGNRSKKSPGRITGAGQRALAQRGREETQHDSGGRENRQPQDGPINIRPENLAAQKPASGPLNRRTSIRRHLPNPVFPL